MESQKREEIDTVDMLSLVGKGIKNFVRGIFRHFIVFGLVSIVFIGAAILLLMNETEYYKTEVVVRNSTVPNSTSRAILDHITSNTNSFYSFSKNSNSHHFLQREMGISSEMAANIKSFGYMPLDPSVEELYSDSIAKKYPFKIWYSVYDTTNALEIENTILNYLRSIPYFQKVERLERERMLQNITIIDSLLVDVNTVMFTNKGATSLDENANGSFVIDPYSPIKAISQKEGLSNKKLFIKKRLHFIDNFQVIKSGANSFQVANISSIMLVIVFWAIGFVLTLLFFGVRRMVK